MYSRFPRDYFGGSSRYLIPLCLPHVAGHGTGNRGYVEPISAAGTEADQRGDCGNHGEGAAIAGFALAGYRRSCRDTNGRRKMTETPQTPESVAYSLMHTIMRTTNAKPTEAETLALYAKCLVTVRTAQPPRT
jgi:hypothetical protein